MCVRCISQNGCDHFAVISGNAFCSGGKGAASIAKSRPVVVRPKQSRSMAAHGIAASSGEQTDEQLRDYLAGRKRTQPQRSARAIDTLIGLTAFPNE
jgi:hypothetical protein